VKGKPLSADFYARDTVRVARALLGCVLESRLGGARTAGRIVEVEAYVGPDDPAAHGYGNKKTKRNEHLFGPPATSYVYFTYGMHWCFNAVTESEGFPAAVLVRALEPLYGVAVMMNRRGIRDEHKLCSGPARLCEALSITGSIDGTSLVEGPVRIIRPPQRGRIAVDVGPRIGISRATSWPLRFVVRGSSWLSRPGPKERRA
jgi:DNA-3-methyladenine glycosylase